MLCCCQNVAIFVLVLVLFTGCQTTAVSVDYTNTVVSMEEARKIALEFKIANHVAPPRTIDDLRAVFQEGRVIPPDCNVKKQRRRDQILIAQNQLEIEVGHKVVTEAARLVTLSERLMSTGRFDEAINEINRAYNKVPNSNYAVRKAIFATQLARLQARIGNLDQAEEQFSISSFWWNETNVALGQQGSEHVQIMGTLRSWLDKPTGQLYLNAGLAALARLRGEIPVAEYHYREAINNLGIEDQYSHINQHELRADLAMTVMWQDRLMEAETDAREAIDLIGIKSSSTINYDGNSAAPVVALAAILLEQGKVADAEYLASMAVNMHEAGCSEPESLGINEARNILINAMAEQGNWPGILRQVNQARQVLVNNEALFQRQYGTSLAYIEAEINVGTGGIGRALANQLRENSLEEDGLESYKAAEIEAILGLIEFKKLNQYGSALKRLSKAIPALLQQTDRQEIAANGRLERILEGYMDLLISISKTGEYRPSGINIPGELLRVASFLNRGRVDRAFAANVLRAAVDNPAVSQLVRLEQDLNEAALSLRDILAYVQSAPADTSTLASVQDLKIRLNDLTRSRIRVEQEIQDSFPVYAELRNPRPITVDEIQKNLGLNQALLVFHVGKTSTYAWAISSKGELNFTEIDISRERLSRKISKLRHAVDPGVISTLEDIPVFDVDLAHELYVLLLKPVRDSWKDANEIFVVAGGALGTLPVSMLVTEPGIVKRNSQLLFDQYRSVQWLANEVAVTQLPSVNALKSINMKQGKTRITRRPYIGFGDPVFSDQKSSHVQKNVASRGFSLRSMPQTRSASSAGLAQLPQLPDTRDEVLSIAMALNADLDQDVYLGVAASEQSVKSINFQKYKIVSFATHSLLPGDLNGLDEPALALSSPSVTNNDEDGLLTMKEVISLKLDADLVILSACNTAASDNKGVEAVSGLGRAFFYAGAKALLVSNWPVHSEATSNMMIIMFKRLAQEDTLSRAEALRQAKLYQINQGGFLIDGQIAFSYAHPIFWAPFSLVGTPGK
jgi:CHAT domain-containing protein/tetratricopeptide (TPR) repeat protein